MLPTRLFCLTAIVAALTTTNLSAQQTSPDCVQWKKYTDTVWISQDVTENRLVSETSYETKEVTKSRPRWISEERERTITEEKPVKQTRDKIVTRKVRKPVTTTKTRTRTRVEESFDEVTEMRDETYTVRKPVSETIIKKEEVLVRKPVTQRTIEKQAVTLYRPEETTQTTFVPGTLLVPGQTASRSRVRWLPRGYYGDPNSGRTEWRRSGLHWVNEPVYGQSAVPVAVPQQNSSVTLVPETIVREKPVEKTTFVNRYETREVPVEVNRMVEETRTRKVPYTVRVPKRKVIEEEIPYTETTYVEETITERVPVTETVMKTVKRTVPYTQIRETWQDYTETVRVPKTTTKRVPYVAKYRVPYLVEVRVPLDANGQPVARGQQIPGTHRLHPAWRNMITKVKHETATEKISETSAPKSIFEKPDYNAAQSILSKDVAEQEVAEPKPLGEAPKNLRFPKSVDANTEKSITSLKPIARTTAEPVSADPKETEASVELGKRIEERFSNLGLQSPEPKKAIENVQTVETSASIITEEVEIPEPPAKATFQPEALSFEIEVPESAQPPVGIETPPSVDGASDATIEPDDVDLSRLKSS